MQPVQVVNLPHNTTAKGAMIVYHQAFKAKCDASFDTIMQGVKANEKNRHDVVLHIPDDPHVFYAVSFMAIAKYENVNLVFDSDIPDIRVHLRVNPHESLNYRLPQRAYFRSAMTDEQIDRRMARVHKVLFPSVFLVTPPEDVNALDSKGCEKPPATAQPSAAPPPATPPAAKSIAPPPATPPAAKPDVVAPPATPSAAKPDVVALPPDPSEKATSCCPRALARFFSAWVFVMAILYAWVMYVD